MTDTSKLSQKRVQRPGFTLVELLVVIGIIVLLISILLPTVGRVRVQAQAAKTQATMSAMAAAMERYHADFRAYPGLFSNAQVGLGVTPTGLGSTLTQTENGVAALVGGIDPDASVQPAYIEASIGKGPMTFSGSIVNRKRMPAYIDASPGTMLPALPYSSTGIAANKEDLPGTPPTTPDSQFPEIYDGYSQSRPIIYLRANLGAAGVASPMGTANPTGTALKQYTTYDFTRYQRGASGSFVGDFQFLPNNDDRYPNLDTYIEQQNVAGEPKGKDKFILVSAGIDRTFGTRDDQFYGGGR